MVDHLALVGSYGRCQPSHCLSGTLSVVRTEGFQPKCCCMLYDDTDPFAEPPLGFPVAPSRLGRDPLELPPLTENSCGYGWLLKPSFLSVDALGMPPWLSQELTIVDDGWDCPMPYALFRCPHFQSKKCDKGDKCDKGTSVVVGHPRQVERRGG